jgi:hypothetical protein
MPFRFADAIFWVAVACCAIAQVAILRSVLRTHAAGHLGASATTPSSSRRAIEIAWAVIPGFALAAVLVFTWRAMR